MNGETQGLIHLFPEQTRGDVPGIEGIARAHRVGSRFGLNRQFRPLVGFSECTNFLVATNDDLARTALGAAARKFYRLGLAEDLAEFLIAGEHKVAALDERQHKFDATVRAP